MNPSVYLSHRNAERFRPGNGENKMNKFLYGFYSFVKLDECVQAYELGHPVECDGDNNRAEIHENKEA